MMIFSFKMLPLRKARLSQQTACLVIHDKTSLWTTNEASFTLLHSTWVISDCVRWGLNSHLTLLIRVMVPWKVSVGNGEWNAASTPGIVMDVKWFYWSGRLAINLLKMQRYLILISEKVCVQKGNLFLKTGAGESVVASMPGRLNSVLRRCWGHVRSADQRDNEASQKSHGKKQTQRGALAGNFHTQDQEVTSLLMLPSVWNVQFTGHPDMMTSKHKITQKPALRIIPLTF